MSKDAWIAAHEELIDEYLDTHINASWYEAYYSTAWLADARLVDNIAAMIDEARDRAKGN